MLEQPSHQTYTVASILGDNPLVEIPIVDSAIAAAKIAQLTFIIMHRTNDYLNYWMTKPSFNLTYYLLIDYY